ncbi:GSCFA domain-containing protein [Azospirillum formosense]|nr:GSCFA domain-containing protein [Azospirillum formosense]MBY3757582.1 hypothetical protein [Azospirillum formosense]
MASMIAAGKQWLENGDPVAAAAALTPIVENARLLADALFHRGLAMHRLGDFQKARHDIVQAARIDLGFYTLGRNLGLGGYLTELSGPVTEVGEGVYIHEGTAGRQQARLWPVEMNISEIVQLRRHAQRELVDLLPHRERFLSPGDKVITFGSCFAVNIGRSLTRLGLDVLNYLIPEDINSTFANRHMLRWLCGEQDKFTSYFANLQGEERRASLCEGIKASRLLVVTVGVAPCLFNEQSGEFAFTSRKNDKVGFAFGEGPYRLRTTTVAENTENLDCIFDSLRRMNPAAQIVLSVSPVPLVGTNEFPSVIQADCISKSTIRLAVHEVTSKRPDILYWPAFEIVRWLGGHSDFRVFGSDDCHSRHVSNAVIDMIMGLFVERYLSQEPA